MTGQMHLAILADDFCVPVDQDRRVEMMTIGGELGVTERQTDAILCGLFEQRTRSGVRHLAFEPRIAICLVGHVPAREKRRQRKLRIDDEVASYLRLRWRITIGPALTSASTSAGLATTSLTTFRRRERSRPT